MDQQRRVVEDIRPARSLDGMGPVRSRVAEPGQQPQPAPRPQPAPPRPQPAPMPVVQPQAPAQRPVPSGTSQRPAYPAQRQAPQPTTPQQPVAQTPAQPVGAPRKKNGKLRTAISAIGIFLLILALLGGIAYIFFQYYR